MSNTLVQTRPITLLTTSPEIPEIAVSLFGLTLFSLFGLTLSVVILSFSSAETISMMFSSIG